MCERRWDKGGGGASAQSLRLEGMEIDYMTLPPPPPYLRRPSTTLSRPRPPRCPLPPHTISYRFDGGDDVGRLGIVGVGADADAVEVALDHELLELRCLGRVEVVAAGDLDAGLGAQLGHLQVDACPRGERLGLVRAGQRVLQLEGVDRARGRARGFLAVVFVVVVDLVGRGAHDEEQREHRERQKASHGQRGEEGVGWLGSRRG
jgi:hypothetical protein